MTSRYNITASVLAEVMAERGEQDRKWGEQNHPLVSPGDPEGIYLLGRRYRDFEQIAKVHFSRGERSGALILLEEVFEALAARDLRDARTELVQVAAVACMLVEGIDRVRATDGTAEDKTGAVRPCDTVPLPDRMLDAEVVDVVSPMPSVSYPEHDHGEGPKPCMCGGTGQAARCTTPETHNWDCDCPHAPDTTPRNPAGGAYGIPQAIPVSGPTVPPEAAAWPWPVATLRHPYNGGDRLHGICRCGEGAGHPVHDTGGE